MDQFKNNNNLFILNLVLDQIQDHVLDHFQIKENKIY